MPLLGGWLNLYQHGVLHRNINLTNVLLRPYEPAPGTDFSDLMPIQIKVLWPETSHKFADATHAANKIESLGKEAGLCDRDGGFRAFVQEDGYSGGWNVLRKDYIYMSGSSVRCSPFC